tara:strand:+ start:164 stop:718 length:555 start_codon:yes stop_codon:yes gene_type:complete
MAEKIKENQFDKVGVNPFNAPIPGESLTTATDMPKSWERPPQYTNPDKCMEAIYMELTADETLRELVTLIDEKTPLDQIAQVVLYRGYTQGLWNPDLMIMLIEPTIYLLIAIADYADIKDYILYDGEEDDPDAKIYNDDVEPVMMDEDEAEKPRVEKPSSEVLSPSLLSRIETELPEKLSKENK